MDTVKVVQITSGEIKEAVLFPAWEGAQNVWTPERLRTGSADGRIECHPYYNSHSYALYDHIRELRAYAIRRDIKYHTEKLRETEKELCDLYTEEGA